MAKLLQNLQEFDENLIVSVNLSGKQFDQEDIVRTRARGSAGNRPAVRSV